MFDRYPVPWNFMAASQADILPQVIRPAAMRQLTADVPPVEEVFSPTIREPGVGQEILRQIDYQRRTSGVACAIQAFFGLLVRAALAE